MVGEHTFAALLSCDPRPFPDTFEKRLLPQLPHDRKHPKSRHNHSDYVETRERGAGGRDDCGGCAIIVNSGNVGEAGFSDIPSGVAFLDAGDRGDYAQLAYRAISTGSQWPIR